MEAKFKFIPKWVSVIFNFLEFIDYKIAGKISRMTSRRFDLLDNHCICKECEKRDPERKHKKWGGRY